MSNDDLAELAEGKKCETCKWWSAVKWPWGICAHDDVLEIDTTADYDWCRYHHPREQQATLAVVRAGKGDRHG